jgi:hypothetical protein
MPWYDASIWYLPFLFIDAISLTFYVARISAIVPTKKTCQNSLGPIFRYQSSILWICDPLKTTNEIFIILQKILLNSLLLLFSSSHISKSAKVFIDQAKILMGQFEWMKKLVPDGEAQDWEPLWHKNT